ncbi:HGxxPAAW family protein [Cellulomonas sp. Marseille-Q8402]
MVEQSVRSHGVVTGAAQQTPRTETLRLPPTAPPTNHGHTTAAWTTTVVVLIGSVAGALGLIFALMWLFWAGLGVALLGVVVGVVLRQLGYGQGGKHTIEKARRTGGH